MAFESEPHLVACFQVDAIANISAHGIVVAVFRID